jgi:hypothetical protein
MKINLDQKTKIIIAGFFIAIVTVFSIVFGTSDFFKGAIESGNGEVMTNNELSNTTTPASLTKDLALLSKELGSAQNQFDMVLELIESPGVTTYDSFDVIANTLDQYSLELDLIESDIVSFDSSTFAALSDVEQSELEIILTDHRKTVNNMQDDLIIIARNLNKFLATVVFCPIEESEPNAVIFDTNHSTFSLIIETFNTKEFFVSSDVEDLKDFIVNLSTTNNAVSDVGCLDYSSHTKVDIEEETQILLNSFEDKTLTEIINFGNSAISTYNTNVVTCYIENGCDSLSLMTNIDNKVICTKDQTFNSTTGKCVGAICPSNDLMADLNIVYTTLENYIDTPELFEENGRSLLESAVLNLDIATDVTTFDYLTETDVLVDELNSIISNNSNDLCNTEKFSYLIITSSNIDSNTESKQVSNQASSLTCPTDSLAIPELDSCVCPDESVIATGEDCPAVSNSTDENTATENTENSEDAYQTCENGLLVLDLNDCPDTIQGQNTGEIEESTSEENIVSNNNDTEFLRGSEIEVTQNSEFGLESNTQANVLNSPLIQGETGSEAIAILLVLLIGMFNIYVWVK